MNKWNATIYLTLRKIRNLCVAFIVLLWRNVAFFLTLYLDTSIWRCTIFHWPLVTNRPKSLAVFFLCKTVVKTVAWLFLKPKLLCKTFFTHSDDIPQALAISITINRWSSILVWLTGASLVRNVYTTTFVLDHPVFDYCEWRGFFAFQIFSIGYRQYDVNQQLWKTILNKLMIKIS